MLEKIPIPKRGKIYTHIKECKIVVMFSQFYVNLYPLKKEFEIYRKVTFPELQISQYWYCPPNMQPLSEDVREFVNELSAQRWKRK